MRHIFIWGCTCLAFLPVLTASGAVEEGAAKETPWSGYWWPISKGEIQVPLSKYDKLTGAASAQWERQNHPDEVAFYVGPAAAKPPQKK